MLGWKSLSVHEFPEMKDKIAELAKTDDGFAAGYEDIRQPW